MNHNWSATKHRLHPQSVAEISRHSVLPVLYSILRIYKLMTFISKTLSNFPTETGISTQNFRIAKSMSDAEVNFFKYSLESVHKQETSPSQTDHASAAHTQVTRVNF